MLNVSRTTYVFSYPSDDAGIRKETMNWLVELVEFLQERYRISMPVCVKDGCVVDHAYAELLHRFIEAGMQQVGHVSIFWILALRQAAEHPDTLKDVKPLYSRPPSNLPAQLQDYLDEAAGSPLWRVLDGKHMVVSSGGRVKLRPGEGPWGGTLPQGDVAIETEGIKQIVFHEFLHMYGVNEGYFDDTKATKSGCENCWMQFNAHFGHGLCEEHQQELKKHLARQLGQR